MKKTIALTSVIAITAVSVAVLVKKIISDKDETYMNTPSLSIDEEDKGFIRIDEHDDSLILTVMDEDDDIISVIKNLMTEECSSFKYAVLEAALSQAENGEIEEAKNTLDFVKEDVE